VQGDLLLLRQLLNNLVSNAVRYCRPGGWIEITARRLPAGVEVVFANASAPIGAEDRQRFFDRFYRGDPSRNRAVEGSGLGLSLAREIARAHGGELTLEPGPADQVTLRLSLPPG
jgi:signal transduction histidine kinase